MGQGGCTAQAINRGELFGGMLLSTAQQSGVAMRVPSLGAKSHAFHAIQCICIFMHLMGSDSKEHK